MQKLIPAEIKIPRQMRINSLPAFWLDSDMNPSVEIKCDLTSNLRLGSDTMIVWLFQILFNVIVPIMPYDCLFLSSHYDSIHILVYPDS